MAPRSSTSSRCSPSPTTDQRTAGALRAKGYQNRFLFAQNAGHCSGKLYDLPLAETLLWAWRGYPVE